MTAREALLRWARRSTARYPGVRVTDFTGSWRDGLAFSALIHRNRPDLVDWRGARASQPRERLDRVFHVAEREYGVTRLLDPEGKQPLFRSFRPPIYSFSRVSPLPFLSPAFSPPLGNARAAAAVRVRRPFPADAARTVTRAPLFHPLLFPFCAIKRARRWSSDWFWKGKQGKRNWFAPDATPMPRLFSFPFQT